MKVVQIIQRLSKNKIKVMIYYNDLIKYLQSTHTIFIMYKSGIGASLVVQKLFLTCILIKKKIIKEGGCATKMYFSLHY